MKLKWIIPIISAVLIVIFFIADKYSAHDSSADKWYSFGLGFSSAVFVTTLIPVILKNSRKKSA
jgi:hypothetical protein